MASSPGFFPPNPTLNFVREEGPAFGLSPIQLLKQDNLAVLGLEEIHRTSRA